MTSVRSDATMIRGTPFRFLVAITFGAAAVSCAHPDYEPRVVNIGEGGSGYSIERVPLDRPTPPPVTPLPPGNATVHETGVRKAQSDWTAALTSASPSALADLMEEGCVIIGPDGGMMAKADFVGLVGNGQLVVQSATISDAAVVEYGNAAFMTGIVTVKAQRDGSDISGSYRFADTWIWKSGTWKKAASVFLQIKE
jgi:ketosteroid isomerase-like protein